MEIKYCLGKANMVANALRRKLRGSFGCLLTQEKELLKEFEELHIKIVLPRDKGYLIALQVASPLVDWIKKR